MKKIGIVSMIAAALALLFCACGAPADAGSGAGETCVVSVDCGAAFDAPELDAELLALLPEDGMFLTPVEIGSEEGDTALSVLQRAARAEKLPVEVSGSYVEGIGGLYEFDGGAESGWRYRVNGDSPGVSAGSYEVEPGDRVEWYYTLTLSMPEVPTEDRLTVLMSGIADGYEGVYENTNIFINMAACEAAAPNCTRVPAATMGRYEAYIGEVLAGEDVDEVTCALSALGLKSFGGDASVALALLDTVSHAVDPWVTPYTLAAWYGEADYADEASALVAELLEAQQADGSWTAWGESVQATANVLPALALYAEQDGVQAALDAAVGYLSAVQMENGGFDAYGTGADANSSAVVVTALCALGIDPESDARFVKDGGSALSCLLTFALADNSGFGYQDNTEWNEFATADAFRAVISAYQILTTGESFNVYAA